MLSGAPIGSLAFAGIVTALPFSNLATDARKQRARTQFKGSEWKAGFSGTLTTPPFPKCGKDGAPGSSTAFVSWCGRLGHPPVHRNLFG